MRIKAWTDLPEEMWQSLTLELPEVSEPRRGLWSRGLLLKEIQSSPLLWVHLLEGQIGALVTARQGDHCVAEIIYLYTALPFRRRGLMKVLLGEVFESFPHSQLWLEVASSNKEAQNLYESLGFHHQGVREAYYSDGTDSWVYRRGGQAPQFEAIMK